ncbi:hypothetical protein HKBW3S47_01329, partial [Candidatus Hakubella thermalkaliphila]
FSEQELDCKDIGVPQVERQGSQSVFYLENRPSIMQQPPRVRGSLYSPYFHGSRVMAPSWRISWIKPVFEDFYHLLTFPTGNLIFDCPIPSKFHRSNIIASRPKGRQFLSQMLLPIRQLRRSKVLKFLDSVMNWQSRFAQDQDGNVVRANLKCPNPHPI